MRVLYLSLTPSMRLDDPSGYATHMRGVVRALREAGHDVILSVATGGGVSPAGESPPAGTGDGGGGAGGPAGVGAGGRAGRGAGVLKDRLPAGLRHLLRDLRELALDRRALPRLRRLLATERIEAVYERAGMLATAGLEAAAAAGLPHVLEVNTPIEERRDHHGFPLYRAGVRYQRRQLALADRISCVSTPLKRYLVERGMEAERVHVIPNAVHPPAYQQPVAERAARRAELGIGDDQVAIGFVGRFGFWHGMMPLVEALARVLREKPEAHAVLIGDGQLMPEVRRYVARTELESRWTLTGSLDWREVPARVAALDIGLMASSNWYGSPMKIFEYGAAGLCVVAPRVEPVAEVMVDGTDGVLVPPGDAEALARVVTELVGDAERRQRLAATFRRKVEQRHAWSRVGERVSELFRTSPRRPRRAPIEGSPCAS